VPATASAASTASSTSSVIVAIVFQEFLDKDFGWANALLRAFGLPIVPWLTNAVWAKFAIIFLAHWQGLGYNILIMLGGLQSIEREIYEAAAIDGAGRWQTFWRITTPLIVRFCSSSPSSGQLAS
jgi:ABC-type sugar transport system permease subunit